MRFDLGADDPRYRAQTHVQRSSSIGDLRGGYIHPRLRSVVESAIANVAHYPDDLPFRFVLKLPHDSSADGDAAIERIVAFDPILFGHSLVDDHDCRR